MHIQELDLATYDRTFIFENDEPMSFVGGFRAVVQIVVMDTGEWFASEQSSEPGWLAGPANIEGRTIAAKLFLYPLPSPLE